MQFTHATSDRDVAERLWADRIGHAYPYRALLDAGAVIAGGSDAPIEPLAPLDGLRAAVLRTLDDRPAWRPGAGAPARRGARRLHHRARLAGGRGGRAAAGSRPASRRTSSCSTATRADDLAGARVAATMLAGEWRHA